MATVTMSRAYFGALLQRARFHTSAHEFELASEPLSHVTVSRAEYDRLQQSSQEYGLLKNALLRGGFTMDALSTLLVGESEATNCDNARHAEKKFLGHMAGGCTPQNPYKNDPSVQKSYSTDSAATSEDTETVSERSDLARPRPLYRTYSNNQTKSHVGRCLAEEQDCRPGVKDRHRMPAHDQRTILISNLAERTTYKDIAGIIRGGQVLEIFFRNDRSVVVSFVGGAADFLAYVKRNDIYLHGKRLDFRWADRQFSVSPRVADKIAGGASRNLIVRGVAGRVSAEQIRDHLDHIHNLVVVDVYFKNRNAHISINSIHNALSARACMMSRTIYRGTRIDWDLDECAASLPQPGMKVRPSVIRIHPTPLPVTNTFALLDTASEIDSDSQSDSYKPAGIRLGHSSWANSAIA
ncbi:hypothetical protein SVAN01_01438 [Stagonosporopsis vannaccii]|nr:hypothetical protein SVAN01_01438 [Stagonosporopsis vannaccii]